jgi:hypothetical protein
MDAGFVDMRFVGVGAALAAVDALDSQIAAKAAPTSGVKNQQATITRIKT